MILNIKKNITNTINHAKNSIEKITTPSPVSATQIKSLFNSAIEHKNKYFILSGSGNARSVPTRLFKEPAFNDYNITTAVKISNDNAGRLVGSFNYATREVDFFIKPKTEIQSEQIRETFSGLNAKKGFIFGGDVTAPVALRTKIFSLPQNSFTL